ncbi:MAG TPA: hypothetical protein VGS57_04055 [Thermoanaerobaculia bacterium]|jgi:hypothetical protein|nr:hypothetical protein [Thermoanaerobaculia bacterium]
MKKPAFVVLCALALTFAAAPFALAHDHGHEQGSAAAATSWKGEIVDMACYVPHGAKGAGHADCAKKCAKMGQPLGLLTGDGDLVLLMANHEDTKPFESVKEMAGSMVEITGTSAERDGVTTVTVTGVKPAA